MLLNGVVPPPDRSPRTLAAGRLGTAAVVFLALAATAPLTVLTTVVPAAYARGDAPLVPLAFVAVALILLLFGVGYAAMARRAPIAGALYAFIARGLGRPAGVGAAWLALLSYQALQISLYAAAGARLTGLPWWAAVGGCWAVVAVAGLIRVEITAGLVGLVVIAEAAVITGFALADVLEPAGGRIGPDTIRPAALDRPVIGVLLVVAALAFTGFETTGAYSEETMRARRSVGRATTITIVLAMLIMAVTSWAMIVAGGPGLLFDQAAARLAPWAVVLGRVLLVTGLVAAQTALHQTLTRYLFALGREQILPRGLGRTSGRTSVPWIASLTQSLLALIVLAACLWAGVRPDARLAVAGGLGILVLLTATALSALLFLNRSPGDENVWRRLVAPGLATVCLGTIAYLAYANLPTLIGTALPRWSLPVAFGAAVLLGMAYGMALRLTGPVVYAGIGLGGTAVVVAPKIPAQRSRPGAHRPERVKPDPTRDPMPSPRPDQPPTHPLTPPAG